VNLMQRQPRVHDEGYLNFIRGLPCIVCGNNIETQAAHIRMADPRILKRQAGMQEKPDDVFTLPLCGKHHEMQHRISEHKFWLWVGVDPILVALALHYWRGNQEKCEQILQARS
jgi:hypothetical protein